MRTNELADGQRSMGWARSGKLTDLEMERVLLPESLNVNASPLQLPCPTEVAL